MLNREPSKHEHDAADERQRTDVADGGARVACGRRSVLGEGNPGGRRRGRALRVSSFEGHSADGRTVGTG